MVSMKSAHNKLLLLTHSLSLSPTPLSFPLFLFLSLTHTHTHPTSSPHHCCLTAAQVENEPSLFRVACKSNKASLHLVSGAINPGTVDIWHSLWPSNAAGKAALPWCFLFPTSPLSPLRLSCRTFPLSISLQPNQLFDTCLSLLSLFLTFTKHSEEEELKQSCFQERKREREKEVLHCLLITSSIRNLAAWKCHS